LHIIVFTIIIKLFQICRRNAVFGDGFFYKKTAAFLAGSNTSIRNLHYASWDNNVNQTPFSIVTDEETHSIVVSIRGSSSINDFLTDVDFTDSHLSHIVKSLILDGENVNSIALGGKDQSRAGVASPNGEVRMKDDQQGQPLPVHGGMFSAAMVMLGFVLRVVVNIKQKKDYADYKVVVTGHSLGAGVASLLTLMLKFISLPTIE
jgi:sn1-specific diacylglycerol lipase